MNSKKATKIFVFALIIVFYGSFLVHKIELPAADDLCRHIKNGELILSGNSNVISSNFYSYTEPDFPFINHHWLAGVIFYLLQQILGWGGLVIFKTIVLLGAFSLVFLTAIKKSNFWLVSFFSIPTILILSERTALRPEIFSYLFVALFIYLLFDLEEHPERNRIFWLAPIQLLWVNLHLFFILGIALVAAFLLEKIVINYRNLKDNVLVKKLAILLFLLIVLCFFNPNGVPGAIYPAQIFDNYGVNIGENNPPSSFLKWRPPQDNISIIVFFWAVFFFIISFFLNSRKRLFYLLISLGTVIGSFLMLRLMPFFALIFLLLVTSNFNVVFSWLENYFKKNGFKNLKTALILVFMATLTYLIYLSSAGHLSSYKEPGLGLKIHVNDSGEFFKNNKLEGPIFNSFDIGSYLIYHLYPKEKVFVDNRSEAYSELFLKDTYLKITQNETDWHKALAKYQFNSIFLYQYESNLRNFIYRRMHDPSWSLVYVDEYAVIFLRNNSINTDIIDKFKITSENVEQKLQPLWQSEDYDNQVAAADVFNLLDRTDLGTKTFLKIVAKWPNKGRPWMILGELEIINNNPILAVKYFEKAIKAGYTTPESYRLLGEAYVRLGEFGKAKDSIKKALKINPDDKDAQELLNRIF